MKIKLEKENLIAVKQVNHNNLKKIFTEIKKSIKKSIQKSIQKIYKKLISFIKQKDL